MKVREEFTCPLELIHDMINRTQKTQQRVLCITKMINLLFCLNATVPVFLVMMAGYILRCMKMLDESFINKLNHSNFPHPKGVLNLENSILQPIKKA